MLATIHHYQEHKNEDDSEAGFTLIELLIVIVVLGILAAVTVFALNSVTGTSAVSACNSDAASVNTAEAAYQAQNNGNAAANVAALSPTYLQSVPGTSHYVISLAAAARTTAPAYGVGAVLVQAPISVTAANAVPWVPGDPNGACTGAK